MIAKFHSAPGHSMETTLTISLPPVQSVKTSRAEREREREREREWEKEQAREKEKREKKERKKEEQEREKELVRTKQVEAENENIRQREREREREHQLREQDRASRPHHPERNFSYKDKFQRMREKYDKATHVQESSQRELDTLHAKLKKLQAENELLLDAMLTSETSLYETYFPRPGSSSPLLGPSEDPTPQALLSNTPSQMPTPHPGQYTDIPHPPPHSGSSGSNPGSMAPPISTASSGAPPPPTTGFRTMPPPLSPMPPPTIASSNGIALASNSMPPPLSTTSSSNGSSTTAQRTSSGEQRSVHYESPESGRRRRVSGRRMNPPPGWAGPVESEEPSVNGDGLRTPTRLTTPVAVSVGDTSREGEELGVARSPRVNGTTGPVISSPAPPNGFGTAASPRRQIEPSRETTPLAVPQSNRLRDDDDDDGMDGGDDDDDVDDEGPSPPGPDAGAGVHSPTDAEEEEDRNGGGMDVDVEADDDKALDISPRMAASIGSLRRGTRGRT